MMSDRCEHCGEWTEFSSELCFNCQDEQQKNFLDYIEIEELQARLEVKDKEIESLGWQYEELMQRRIEVRKLKDERQGFLMSTQNFRNKIEKLRENCTAWKKECEMRREEVEAKDKLLSEAVELLGAVWDKIGSSLHRDAISVFLQRPEIKAIKKGE